MQRARIPAAALANPDADLLEEAGRHVARYKLPKALVRVDRVRRAPSGKADYRWAKKLADSELARTFAHEICHFMALQHVVNKGLSGKLYPAPKPKRMVEYRMCRVFSSR